MMRPRAAWVLACCCFLAACAGQPGPAPPTTVFVVRHAEKAAGDDPPLTEAGRERALALARVLGDAEVEAVYATPYLRNQETAAPLAAAAGVAITTHTLDGDDHKAWAKRFGAKLLEEHASGRVVVVGHSNTVALLVESLGVAGAPQLDEADYDDLFVVTVEAAKRARLLHLHYGAASP